MGLSGRTQLFMRVCTMCSLPRRWPTPRQTPHSVVAAGAENGPLQAREHPTGAVSGPISPYYTGPHCQVPSLLPGRDAASRGLRRKNGTEGEVLGAGEGQTGTQQ